MNRDARSFEAGSDDGIPALGRCWQPLLVLLPSNVRCFGRTPLRLLLAEFKDELNTGTFASSKTRT